MKKPMYAFALVAAMTLAPAVSNAKTVNVTVNLKQYNGYPAFLAVYLTDAQGHYKETIHLAGFPLGYFGHLRHWLRESRGQVPNLDSITGASVGPGQTLQFSADIADALLNAGYQIHIDDASEWMMEVPNDAVVSLDAQNAGKPVPGKTYIQDMSFTM